MQHLGKMGSYWQHKRLGLADNFRAHFEPSEQIVNQLLNLFLWNKSQVVPLERTVHLNKSRKQAYELYPHSISAIPSLEVQSKYAVTLTGCAG